MGVPIHINILEFWNFLLQLKKSDVLKQNCVWLFYYFIFKTNCHMLKSKSPCILVNKNINFKTKLNRKWKIPPTVLERRTLRFSSSKNCKLKVNLWLAGAHQRKERAFFVQFILSQGRFFKIRVLSQCIVY